MSDQTIFITGGSGFIGSVVIEYAIADGYTVTALSRTEESDTKLKSLGATPIRGDLKSLVILERETAKADVVINIADFLVDGKMTMEERFSINNAAVAALAAGLKGSGKLLILTGGSLYVKAHPEEKETDESSPGWDKDHPFRWIVLNKDKNLAHAKDGIRVSYCRLAPFVYGRGGSGVKLFMDIWAQAGAGVHINDGKARITTIHVEDTARLYLRIKEGLGKSTTPRPRRMLRTKMGDFFATFLASENRVSNRKAREELGWEIKAENGIIEEIEMGSYMEVAEKSRKGAA
ncbi:NAD(P)-binding protein [Byssothecium circinans]|uniref:NAD(P)-binding protein n=1 Tax=Byssothecium circinans TaxID=147558 RepID=A0A6A5T9U7_9PLEO|nr:NAD(P)-binding protein [Byssothecium circinans]